MYIADMKELAGNRVAVGWLHPAHPFPTGTVPPDFLARLKVFASRQGTSQRVLGWGACGGVHTCEFCDQFIATGSFGVLTPTRLFYAPTMIPHYVEHHGYAPPAEFVEAVLACPLPGTAEYEKAAAPFAYRY